ncbi:MAG: hypothetical protein LYZ69_03020 [Nitrososphaerales archaeon]|nr:hypothetical protein [Nitrososphaerales archaeon]
MRDEFVCSSCGVVTEKEVVESGEGRSPKAIDFTGQALGGYLGPLEWGPRERFSRGLAASPSSFRYLKLVSDFAGREDSTLYSCVKMIERVCEKLSLPGVVMRHAILIAKRLFQGKGFGRATNAATVSAYSIITACKIEAVTTIGVREVVRAHRLLGRRVKASSLIQLSLNSPFKAHARRPEEYVPRVVARLSLCIELTKRLADEGVNKTVYFNSLRTAALEALCVLGEAERGGRSPCALAATAAYAGEALLSRREGRKMRVTQKELAECGDVAEYTVREQYGDLFRPAITQSTIALQPIPTQRM